MPVSVFPKCQNERIVLRRRAIERGSTSVVMAGPQVRGWAGVLLGGTDLVARRLPDALTLPAYSAVAVLLGAAAVGTGCPLGRRWLAAAWLVVLHPPV